MEQGIMDNFNLPQNVEDAGAREAVNKLMFKSIGNNVQVMSGHEQGTAYRFYVEKEFNGAQPKDAAEAAAWKEEGRVWSDSNVEAHCTKPIYKELDAVEFICSKSNHPTQFVKHLNWDRLQIDATGEIIGGSMADDYKRWKEGLGPQGTALETWHEIGPGTLATLQSQNILTIEQFASMPREKVKDLFPPDIVKIFEHLCDYVSGFDRMKARDDDRARIEQLEAEIAALKTNGEVKRGPGRPKKNAE